MTTEPYTPFDAGRMLRLNFSNDLQELVTLAAEACSAPAAALLLFDRTAPWISNRSGVNGRAVLHTVAASLRVIRHEADLVVLDLTQHAAAASTALRVDASGLRFYAGVPLRVPGGHRFGMLCIIDQRLRTVTPEQATVLRTFSKQVSRLAGLALQAGLQNAATHEVEAQRQRILAQSRSLQRIATYLAPHTGMPAGARASRYLPLPDALAIPVYPGKAQPAVSRRLADRAA